MYICDKVYDAQIIGSVDESRAPDQQRERAMEILRAWFLMSSDAGLSLQWAGVMGVRVTNCHLAKPFRGKSVVQAWVPL